MVVPVTDSSEQPEAEQGGFLAGIRERMARAQEVRAAVAGLVGQGEGADGLIKISCTADDPVHDIRLEPRAVRMMSSERLGAEIQRAVRDARDDLQKQTREVFRERLGVGEGAGGMRAELDQLSGIAESSAERAAALFERMRREFGP